MQKIIPYLWFDKEAEEAVEFYTSIFKGTVKDRTYYPESAREISGQEPGSLMTIAFELEGLEFIALNDGPLFKFTPAISFFVSLETREEVDELWKKLSPGGNILMPIDTYPFSERYGWLSDKYGLSFQIGVGTHPQKITPAFLFVGEQNGNAEKAMQFYTSLFPNSKIETIARYGEGESPADEPGNVKYGLFTLEGEYFIIMESGQKHLFSFTPAISLLVNCETQEEVDTLWDQLSAVPEAEQCGWLQDAFGISWQIVPTELGKLMSGTDKEKANRVMAAMLGMKKLDIAALKAAAK